MEVMEDQVDNNKIISFGKDCNGYSAKKHSTH